VCESVPQMPSPSKPKMSVVALSPTEETGAPLLLKIPTRVSSSPSKGPMFGFDTIDAGPPPGFRMMRNWHPESLPTPGHSLKGAVVVGAFAALEEPA
jgi:hypothetical protein